MVYQENLFIIEFVSSIIWVLLSREIYQSLDINDCFFQRYRQTTFYLPIFYLYGATHFWDRNAYNHIEWILRNFSEMHLKQFR